MSETTQIGQVKLAISQGDISRIATEAVIVPNPQKEAGSGGIFDAMHEAGCIAGCEAMRNWHELSTSNMELGSVLTVPSGGGSCKYLSHVASVCEFGYGHDWNFAAVAASVQNALTDLARRGVGKVAIPMMGTGQMGWLNAEQSARAMLIGVDRFSKAHPDSQMEVALVAREQGHLEALQSVVANPEQYTDIPLERIRAEKGKAVPLAAELEPFKSSDPLSSSLPSAPPRYIGMSARRIAGD